MQVVRRLATALIVVALAATLSRPVLANGIGDLYVTTPGGVDELHVATADLVTQVPLSPRPTVLAFSPDGRRLYAAGSDRDVARIDIETLEVDRVIDAGGSVAALAHPRGERLVLLLAGERRLALLDEDGSTIERADPLPAEPTLLAANPREPQAVAAAAGGTWIALVDPDGGSIRTAEVPGGVAALAIGDGTVLVATRTPRELVRFDAASLAVRSRTPLPGPALGLAVLEDRLVVAGEERLWAIDDDGVHELPELGARIVEIAAAGDGRVALVLLAGNRIVAVGGDGVVAGTIALDGGPARGLAPVPGRSSLAGGPAGGDDPPSTDTVLGPAPDRSLAFGTLSFGPLGLNPLALAFVGVALALGAAAASLVLGRHRDR